MPIRIPDHLPARKTLESEGVAVMDSTRADRQDIRPLQIGLLNLMPNKERTETQFARLVGATPLQVNLTLVRISEHQSKNTSEEYLATFYKRWEEVRSHKFDGFLVTGAPIANIPFEEVRYWKEMVEIMDWTQTNVHHTMFICWGAQAALHHFHGVKRKRMPQKAFGVFRHKVVNPRSPYLRGFSDSPMIPVSRYNDIDRSTLNADLDILIDNADIGICLLADDKHRSVHMLNHLEYDNRSLADEYDRDRKGGLDTAPPVNLFPSGDLTQEPENRWRSHAHLLFQNWINEIYQTTPYAIDRIGLEQTTPAGTERVAPAPPPRPLPQPQQARRSDTLVEVDTKGAG